MKGVWIAAGVFLALVTVLAIAGQPAVDNSPKARLQRIKIKDECEKTYGVNSSQSVDCFFIALAERMAAERTGSHPATRLAVVQ
jgi:hypothetical protein